MNILFKCFKCEKETGLKIHSYSWNKEEEPYKIEKLKYANYKDNIKSDSECVHFSNIELKWKTKYRFFTIGWEAEIYNVCIKCNQCNKKTIYFARKIFGYGGNNNYDEPRECCNHIIVYSAHEGKFECGDKGKELPNNINEQIKAIERAEEENKKLKEAQEQLEKEEKLWKQKEEEEKREREEEEKKQKEREQRRRSQYEQENKEMLEIEKQQEKENKEMNKKINIGASWIEEQMSQMISEANDNISRNINYNARKTIKANTQFQVGK